MQDVFNIDSSTIDIWRLEINVSDHQYLKFKQHLNCEEVERANRYRHHKAQQQFVAARGQLRQLLAGYLDVNPQSIQFEIGEHGKPRLAGTDIDRELVFNLSHSGSLALVAIGVDRALGVDIELINNRHNLDGLAQRCFSIEERQCWEQYSGSDKTAKFFDYWCAKEAFLKASGRGLAMGMENCIVDLIKPCFAKLPEHHEAADWQLFQIDINSDYCAFVTTNGKPVTITYKKFGCS